MATTSAGITLPVTLPFTPGQGELPVHRIRLSTDPASKQDPTWTELTSRARSYGTHRGREDEWSKFENGNATVDFNDSDRALDPIVNTAIKPMNRLWIYEEFSGEIHDLFKGYVESWQHSYDQSGKSAIATAELADEMKVLSLDGLPVANPPRDNYDDVVLFDKPNNYWRFDEPDGTLTFKDAAENGMELTVFFAGYALADGGAIVGDPANRHIQLSSSELRPIDAPFQGQGGDAAGLSAFTIEAWVSVSDFLADNYIAWGPIPPSGNRQYWFKIKTNGTVEFQVQTNVSSYTATGGSLLTNRFYHLVGMLSGNTAYLFIDGVQIASVATSGTVVTDYNTAVFPPNSRGFALNSSTGTTAFDSVAFYRYAIGSSRIPAHYEAGALRGFPAQSPADRVNAVLDQADTDASRSIIGVTGEQLQPRYMHGQSPLDEIREAEQAALDTSTTPDTIDSAFFVAADGTLTFLGPAHRLSAPYNAVQATFGDAGGSELPYLAIGFDYSESFLRNYWTVTRDGGEAQAAFDQTSIDTYRRRPDSRDGLILVDDADSAAYAAAILAKYKDPFQRVTMIEPKMVIPNVAEAVYRLDLMDRIRVLWTPPGGGARFDQTLFVQKIEHSYAANPAGPPRCRLAISPL